MKKVHYLIAALGLLSSGGYAQSELKLKTGPEVMGLGFEYLDNGRISVEVVGSFWWKNQSNYFINADVDTRMSNLYLTGMIKRYSAKRYPHSGFFYGAYLRYWREFRTIMDEDNWTPEQKSNAETNASWRSTETNKVSIGGVVGHKFHASDRIYLGYTLGIGVSPGEFAYRRRIVDYNRNVEKTGYNRDLMFRELSLASALFQVSVGYRFGSLEE
ncbi:MAG: hypothetical protein KDD36_13080 [Flavobacteriales bacterium]|nr:hypothetical protein [Flavobacteriales bacterium]